MDIQTILINLFASIALISATMVIVSKNPITSVVYLILTFCNATGLLILLKIEFIAMMFLIIYVGAIAVLFLFVVMMLNIKVSELSENWLRYLPIGGVISIIFLSELLITIDQDFIQIANRPDTESMGVPKEWLSPDVCAANAGYIKDLQITPGQKPWASLIDTVTNIESLGLVLFTYHFYYFIMASLILLVAMIGAIVLTMHKRKHAAKKQLIFKQVTRKFEDAIGYAKAQV